MQASSVNFGKPLLRFSWVEIYWDLHKVTKFHVLERLIKVHVVLP